MNLMKYSFVLRYLSNNQIIVYGSLMNIQSPINFHFSTQAFSGSLKPEAEKFNSNNPTIKTTYLGLFGTVISSDKINPNTSKIIKLSLNGFTHNLLINDPIFCMMFLLSMGGIIFLMIVNLILSQGMT